MLDVEIKKSYMEEITKDLSYREASEIIQKMKFEASQLDRLFGKHSLLVEKYLKENKIDWNKYNIECRVKKTLDKYGLNDQDYANVRIFNKYGANIRIFDSSKSGWLA